MSGEMAQLSNLDRDILRLLANGWHTTDHVKSDGILSDAEIAERVSAEVDTVRERLAFLETMGYVVNQQNFGGDPTLTYRGIDQGVSELHRLDARYHVSEHGMRMALSDAMTDAVSQDQPD